MSSNTATAAKPVSSLSAVPSDKSSSDSKPSSTDSKPADSTSGSTPSASASTGDKKADDRKDKVTSEITTDGLRIESNWDQVVTSFDDMGLKDDLLRGIYAYGFEKPSAIQQRGIMPILAGHDTIAQAQSGTGINININTYTLST